MRQVTSLLHVHTPGPGLMPITDRVEAWFEAERTDGGMLLTGMLTLLCQHTSASLTLQENADPDVRSDLQAAFEGLAPPGGRERYAHASEGPDDMAAHIRTVLSGVHLSIPIIGGGLALGPWQGIYLWEHRATGQHRKIALHLLRD